MEDLGLSWDTMLSDQTESHTLDGIYLMKDGEIYNAQELAGRCHVCLNLLAYNEQYDSQFCATCDEWREAACSDPTCDYCLARPEKPSDYHK